ncbi:MAG: hypothetical protein K0S85_76 [Pseudomonas orientalis]|nr:hypothetical protein [Pseudomonas orientalis]
MADPIIINPTLTLAGQAAAFNASNDGLELKITHVSFGTAHYDPTGEELALVAPVGNKVPVAGASRPTPYQIRMVSAWREDVGQVGIGEIAFWAGDTLAFVWSKADGTVASYKTNGVTYVLFNDLAFSAVPANSISFVIDPDESVALAALAAHEGAYNAHPQYVLRAKFPDYQGHLWGDVGGTANAITLTLPEIVELTQYIKGNRFSFKALSNNTGDTTINVEGVGPVQVLKTGGVPLTAGSIVAGGVYDVYYDGAKFQLTAGAGFASAEATEAEVTALTDTNSTSWLSLRRLIKALSNFAKLSGATFTGEVKGVTPAQFDNDTSFITSEYSRRQGLQYSGFLSLSASTPLTLAEVGGLVSFSSASMLTCTLPATNSIPSTAAAITTIVCAGAGGLTIVPAAGGDTVNTSSGVVGSIILGLGDTAEFIRLGGQWRLIGGTVALKYGAVMSGANWTTQPIFDNSKSVATTEFVMRAAGNYRGFTSLTTATTLTASAVGTLVSTIGTFTITLPAAGALPSGGSIHFRNIGGGVVTVVCVGADLINAGNFNQPNSIALQPGATLVLTSNGVAAWWAEGTAQVQFSKIFGDTPAQFDSSKLLATAEFVKRMGVEWSGFTSVSASTVLGNTSAGGIVSASSSTAINVTLPPTGPVGAGAMVMVLCGGTGAVTLLASNGEQITNSSGSAITVVVPQGDSAILTRLTGEWRLVGGTVALKYSASFSCGLGGSGYQKLPSGLIIQWGTMSATCSTTVTSTGVSYPIAFPNAVCLVTGSRTIELNTANSPLISEFFSGDTSTARVTHVRTTGSIAANWKYMAIGY